MPSSHSFEFAKLKKDIEKEFRPSLEEKSLPRNFSFQYTDGVYNVISGADNLKIIKQNSPSSPLLRHVWMKESELNDLVRFLHSAVRKHINIKDVLIDVQNYINTYPATHKSAEDSK